MQPTRAAISPTISHLSQLLSFAPTPRPRVWTEEIWGQGAGEEGEPGLGGGELPLPGFWKLGQTEEQSPQRRRRKQPRGCGPPLVRPRLTFCLQNLKGSICAV